ncbi:hypothetical protein C8R44DRAFT_735850 [Mycena epipterygia]|nr:hypothetical protein C8R44DRAFT_735850 [Mycena epipterygia]
MELGALQILAYARGFPNDRIYFFTVVDAMYLNGYQNSAVRYIFFCPVVPFTLARGQRKNFRRDISSQTWQIFAQIYLFRASEMGVHPPSVTITGTSSVQFRGYSIVDAQHSILNGFRLFPSNKLKRRVKARGNSSNPGRTFAFAPYDFQPGFFTPEVLSLSIYPNFRKRSTFPLWIIRAVLRAAAAEERLVDSAEGLAGTVTVIKRVVLTLKELRAAEDDGKLNTGGDGGGNGRQRGRYFGRRRGGGAHAFRARPCKAVMNIYEKDHQLNSAHPTGPRNQALTGVICCGAPWVQNRRRRYKVLQADTLVALLGESISAWCLVILWDAKSRRTAELPLTTRAIKSPDSPVTLLSSNTKMSEVAHKSLDAADALTSLNAVDNLVRTPPVLANAIHEIVSFAGSLARVLKHTNEQEPVVNHINHYIETVAKWSMMKRYTKESTITRELDKYRRTLLDLFFAGVVTNYLAANERPIASPARLLHNKQPTTALRKLPRKVRKTVRPVTTTGRYRDPVNSIAPRSEGVGHKGLLPDRRNNDTTDNEANKPKPDKPSRWFFNLFVPEASEYDVQQVIALCSESIIRRLDNADILGKDWLAGFEEEKSANLKAKMLIALCKVRHADRKFRKTFTAAIMAEPDVEHLLKNLEQRATSEMQPRGNSGTGGLLNDESWYPQRTGESAALAAMGTPK